MVVKAVDACGKRGVSIAYNCEDLENAVKQAQENSSDGSALELSGLSQEEFREKLREERRLEFILEGQRWFDLIRWHILVKYVKEHTPASENLKLQNVSKRNYLLPLPQDQIILNPNLEQNWGYSGETGDGPYDSSFE